MKIKLGICLTKRHVRYICPYGSKNYLENFKKLKEKFGNE